MVPPWTGLTEGILQRQFKTLPRSPAQCLAVSVTGKIFLPAGLKLLFQYHFPAGELPVHIWAHGAFCCCFFPTSTPSYRSALQQ